MNSIDETMLMSLFAHTQQKVIAQDIFEKYNISNPQAGVHQSYSAHATFTGQQCNIRSSYATKASVEEDLKKMLAANPSGCYAVCLVAV